MSGDAGQDRDLAIATSDGLRLRIREYAARSTNPGVPVLCLPGLTRNGKDFSAFAHRFSASRRVICPDLIGRGLSDRASDWRRYDPRTLLDDIRHVLIATGLHRTAVVGTSLGGAFAAALGCVMPTVLAGAVVNDIGPDIDANGLAAMTAQLAHDHPADDWDDAARFLENCFPELPAHTREEWILLARNTYVRGDDGRLHFDWDPGIVRPFRRSRPLPIDLWALFLGLRSIPCLVLRGAESSIFPRACFEAMKRSSPNWHCVSVPGVGHAPSLGEPEALEALDEFFERIDTAHDRRHQGSGRGTRRERRQNTPS